MGNHATHIRCFHLYDLSEKPPSTPAPGDGRCLPSWIPYGRHCYYVYNGPQGFSWPDSRHYCQVVKAELASVHSRAEVEFIRTLNYTKQHNIWIGLTRDVNCECGRRLTNAERKEQTQPALMSVLPVFGLLVGWGWTDRTSLGFLNWAQGEPNTAFHPGDVADENCVEMYPDGRWNDNNCLQKRGFACRHRQCENIFLLLNSRAE